MISSAPAQTRNSNSSTNASQCRKPTSLSFAQAAAFLLHDHHRLGIIFTRLGIDPDGAQRGQSLPSSSSGAGGVGSHRHQYCELTGLVIITTASRPEAIRQWVLDLGADHVLVDREHAAPPQLAAHGFKTVDFIAGYNNTDAYWDVMAGFIRPQGHMVSIVENIEAARSRVVLKSKSITFAWEFMFTRAMFHDVLTWRSRGIAR